MTAKALCIHPHTSSLSPRSLIITPLSSVLSVSHLPRARAEWGPRSAAACQSAFMSMGSHPTWGAGGSWDCDMPYLQDGATELTRFGGYTPTLFRWHHLVWAYTGATGFPANTLTLYVDGQQNNVRVASRNVQRNDFGVIIGAFKAGAGYALAGQLAISKLRVHSGCLSAADVNYNWMQEQVQFIASTSPTPSLTPSPSSTQVNSLSPTGSAPPTPTGTPCPDDFPFTHVHRAMSLQLAADTSAYGACARGRLHRCCC